ncbi:MAG: transposase, partial [Verrucomicrobiota bacterium]
MEALFDISLKHLQSTHGLALAKEGVMVDASFAEVPRQRNNRKDNATIKAGEIPAGIAAKPKVKAQSQSPQGPGRPLDQKNNETYHGYKDHVKVDVKDKLIIKAVITAASVHDSQALEELIEPGDRVVYADSAYSGAPIQAILEAKNVEAQVRNHRQSRWLEFVNRSKR